MHFHTQKVNDQCQRALLSPSTYAKAQERMLCKFKVFLLSGFYFVIFFTVLYLC